MLTHHPVQFLLLFFHGRNCWDCWASALDVGGRNKRAEESGIFLSLREISKLALTFSSPCAIPWMHWGGAVCHPSHFQSPQLPQCFLQGVRTPLPHYVFRDEWVMCLISRKASTRLTCWGQTSMRAGTQKGVEAWALPLCFDNQAVLGLLSAHMRLW